MLINRLRKKKRWTGRDTGLALMQITILELKARDEGKPTPPEYAELIDLYNQHNGDLITERDNQIFDVYWNLFDGLINAHNLAVGQNQLFFGGIYQTTHYIDLCYLYEKQERMTDTLPLLMTKSQYSRYMSEAWERVKTSKEESFFSVFYQLLSLYLEDGRRAPADIRKAIKALKDEPATNSRVLSAYNKYMKRGYYTLPDGRRSDQTDAGEWKRAISELFPVEKRKLNGRTLSKSETAEKLREELEADYHERLFYCDELPLPEFDMIVFISRRHESIENLRKGEAPAISPEDFNKAESYLYGVGNFPKWEYYTDAPELSKYDMICACLDEYEGEGKSSKEKIALYKELSADAPALVSAMEAHVKKSLPSLSRLTISHYNKKLVTRAELATLPGFEYFTDGYIVERCRISNIIEETEPETFERFRRSKRVLENGIAVVQNPDQTDERGDWNGEDIPLLFENIESVRNKEAGNINYYINKNIKSGIRMILAYNALIDIVGAYYDIKGLSVFKIDEAQVKGKADAFNEYLFRFYAEVYGDDQTKARKRELIKEVFEPIVIDELRPSPDKLEDVAEFFEAEGMTRRGASQIKQLYRFALEIVG